MNTQMHKNESQTVPDFIQSNVPLADKNWFGTGGSAQFFAEPTTAQEMQQAVLFAQQNKLSISLLGKGANMLVSDDGIKGLVIRPKLESISHAEIIDGEFAVTAGAGVDLQELIQYCLQHQLLGLEEFSGIPSTVGGAVYINLHYFRYLLSDFLMHATVLEKKSGALLQVDNEWFAFGYNESKLHEGNHILIDATFRMQQVSELEQYYAMGRRDEIIRHRNARYPSKNTCGSFFRNFYDHEVRLVLNGKKVIWVAYYLDKIGVKGELRVGNAQISHQHANMIVNLGNASSSDIIGVARLMQQKVLDEFGILPQPECRLVGFKDWPLL